MSLIIALNLVYLRQWFSLNSKLSVWLPRWANDHLSLPFSTGITGLYHQIWVFMWVLMFKTHVFNKCLTTKPSPQLSNNICHWARTSNHHGLNCEGVSSFLFLYWTPSLLLSNPALVEDKCNWLIFIIGQLIIGLTFIRCRQCFVLRSTQSCSRVCAFFLFQPLFWPLFNPAVSRFWTETLSSWNFILALRHSQWIRQVIRTLCMSTKRRQRKGMGSCRNLMCRPRDGTTSTEMEDYDPASDHLAATDFFNLFFV